MYAYSCGLITLYRDMKTVKIKKLDVSPYELSPIFILNKKVNRYTVYNIKVASDDKLVSTIIIYELTLI